METRRRFPNRPITNAIEEVVYGIFKGPELASRALGVSRQTVHVWLGRRMIWNRDTALTVESQLESLGYRVPAAELMDLTEWQGGLGGTPRRIPSADGPPPPLSDRSTTPPTVTRLVGTRASLG